ncbi:ABC transporter ATP-binding protein [Thalassotalea sp. LPB0316]|uniref:ABC transporter ATP-binding protein n=1 Tax=Thalassotalea sp. LPB0316 TaxID=2769490 RepID=UPI001865DC0D|nr:ABC transporter ATP-binding protein [Thalassotalea sp. LPB0316]QOL25913.1 ABC transporter ATP-binding protein [Thalassotalea sp. LPB0316]
MQSQPIIVVDALDVELGNKKILNQVAFSLHAGEILGLVGPSGCGKTTLLNTLAGFITPSKGQIAIEELPVMSSSAMLAPEKRHIGVIFQDYALFPHMTVAQNIAYGIGRFSQVTQNEKVTKLVQLLKLDGFEQRFPHQLSGGQQQRVAIARALAPEPKLLLLDEPFSNIDARLRNELMIELRQLLKSLNMTAIFVTHNKDEVFTFADKIAVMHQGNILQFGQPLAVCQQPNSWQVADFLQLGSWLTTTLYQDQLDTPIGLLSVNGKELGNSNKMQLLVKPQHLEIDADEHGESVIHHINVTEQGYHYLVTPQSSEHNYQLSVYSDQAFSVGQRVQLNILPHDYILFQ